MNWMMNRLRIMPLLVVVAALSFGVRFGEFVTGVSSIPGTAQAQMNESAPQDLGAPPSIPAMPMMEQGDETVVEKVPITETSPMEVPSMEDGEVINWKDAADTDLEFSEMRMELFEDLTARRKALSERERELSVREALLKTAEQEIEQKYNELVSLKAEIQDLLVEQNDEEKARTASLVKIYEGMKPKDAARIFNTLDLDVLLAVVSRMSERKSAPVIASMDPARARTLTIMLMEQKSLPSAAEDLLNDAGT